jgi:hypothetical protein
MAEADLLGKKRTRAMISGEDQEPGERGQRGGAELLQASNTATLADVVKSNFLISADKVGQVSMAIHPPF